MGERTDSRQNRSWPVGLVVGLIITLLAGAVFWLQWNAGRMRRVPVPAWCSLDLRQAFRSGALTSDSCRTCHADIYEQWSNSHHAHANRLIQADRDRSAFEAPPFTTTTGQQTRFLWKDGRPLLFASDASGVMAEFHPEMVLAYTPLEQFLVPFGGGRWQATEAAWDPARKEWFNVFGPEGRQSGEWGAWTGRGMNWNSNCAACHMTGYEKNYDIATDTYASRWDEMGVSCLQCHAITKEHFTNPAAAKKKRPDWATAQQNCAACHSRRQEISPGFGPGKHYDDHFSLALPTVEGLYYPDGQVRDEDFEYGSFLMSKMGGRAGITCLDCHNPHTGAMKFPVENNATCLACHAAPGQRGAPAIDPTAHSHHAPDSTGNRCIECHMSQTTYMQRDPRRDHGFIIPDPLMTKELGIPNACNKCHADQTADWAIEWADRWYGAKMDRPERERTRTVARVYQGETTREITDKLLRLAERETIPMWKAALLNMAARRVDLLSVGDALARGLADPNAMVRATSVDGLAMLPPRMRADISALLKDSSRLVRLRAAWALRETLSADSPGTRELLASLNFNADQPAGAATLGQWHFSRGDRALAETWYRKAISWDRFSTPLYEDLALLQNASQEPAQALETLNEGLQTTPTAPTLLNMKALLLAETGDLPAAEKAFRDCLASQPDMPRAWYNLGLLYAQQERLDEALQALQKAESLDADSPDIPYALATIHLRKKDRAAAVAAARRALQIAPGFPAAKNLLDSLGPLP